MKRGDWKSTIDTTLWYTQRPMARARFPGRNSNMYPRSIACMCPRIRKGGSTHLAEDSKAARQCRCPALMSRTSFQTAWHFYYKGRRYVREL